MRIWRAFWGFLRCMKTPCEAQKSAKRAMRACKQRVNEGKPAVWRKANRHHAPLGEGTDEPATNRYPIGTKTATTARKNPAQRRPRGSTVQPGGGWITAKRQAVPRATDADLPTS